MSTRLARAATALLLALPAAGAFAQEGHRVLIGFGAAVDEPLVRAHGGRIVRTLSSSDTAVAWIPADALAGLLAEPAVASVDPDVPVQLPPRAAAAGKGAPKPPAAPSQSTPWGVARVGAPAAWSISRGAGAAVAVVDTGIDETHPDLSGRVLLGPNFNNARKSSRDDNGHGSHVAGTIGAGDNGLGVVGVAPSCTLVAVKVLDRNGSGWLSDVVAGIDWAAANGAAVINLSLGSSADLQALKDSVDAAAAAGVVVCAAAGNDGTDAPLYPAAYPSVLSVAATDAADAPAWFSSFGSTVDLAGPGVDVPSTYKDGGYATLSGTSMATPHVAGTAALLRADGRSADETRGLLLSTAGDLGDAGWDPYTGAGLVNAAGATSAP
jgi:subtilisin family serine protease